MRSQLSPAFVLQQRFIFYTRKNLVFYTLALRTEAERDEEGKLI